MKWGETHHLRKHPKKHPYYWDIHIHPLLFGEPIVVGETHHFRKPPYKPIDNLLFPFHKTKRWRKIPHLFMAPGRFGLLRPGTADVATLEGWAGCRSQRLGHKSTMEITIFSWEITLKINESLGFFMICVCFLG